MTASCINQINNMELGWSYLATLSKCKPDVLVTSDFVAQTILSAFATAMVEITSL